MFSIYVFTPTVGFKSLPRESILLNRNKPGFISDLGVERRNISSKYFGMVTGTATAAPR